MTPPSCDLFCFGELSGGGLYEATVVVKGSFVCIQTINLSNPLITS